MTFDDPSSFNGHLHGEGAAPSAVITHCHMHFRPPRGSYAVSAPVSHLMVIDPPRPARHSGITESTAPNPNNQRPTCTNT